MSTEAAEEELPTAGHAGEAAGGLRTWLEQTWAFTARVIVTLRNNHVMLLLAVGFPPLFYLLCPPRRRNRTGRSVPKLLFR